MAKDTRRELSYQEQIKIQVEKFKERLQIIREETPSAKQLYDYHTKNEKNEKATKTESNERD